jgi:hypothetical protein
MARPTKQESELKLILLNRAFDELKKKSSSSKNLVTYSNLCQVANSYEEAKSFKKPISLGSIKQPTTNEYKKLKDRYDNNKKSIINTNSIDKNKILELYKEIEGLTMQIAILIERDYKITEELESLKLSYKKVSEQRDFYHSKIKNKNGN